MTRLNHILVASIGVMLANSAAALPLPAQHDSADIAAIQPHGAYADSCAAAFATVMAQYLKPELEKRFPGDTAAITEFVNGVAHAFDIKNLDTPYHFGVRNGFGLADRLESMQEIGFLIPDASFCARLADAMKGNAMGFDPTSADDFLHRAMTKMHPQEELKPLSPESQQAFLDTQKKREGVAETPSGLLFEVITEGEGAFPAETDTVRVTYTGQLADGTVFDQTERPIQFPVNRLVPGFTEGLKMMKAGGEYRIFIPPSLGYGDRGAAGVIPPGAALDFTVRLLDILPSTDNKQNNQ